MNTQFYYFDYGARELKQEVVAFMLEKLPKFVEGKGKAFSYFSIVAKNYLIQNNNKNYKALKEKAPVVVIDSQRDLTNEQIKKEYDEQRAAFMEAFVEYYDKKIPTIFKSDRDRRIAYAVMQLFRERENIENFNKKGFYYATPLYRGDEFPGVGYKVIFNQDGFLTLARGNDDAAEICIINKKEKREIL